MQTTNAKYTYKYEKYFKNMVNSQLLILMGNSEVADLKTKVLELFLLVDILFLFRPIVKRVLIPQHFADKRGEPPKSVKGQGEALRVGTMFLPSFCLQPAAYLKHQVQTSQTAIHMQFAIIAQDFKCNGSSHQCNKNKQITKQFTLGSYNPPAFKTFIIYAFILSPLPLTGLLTENEFIRKIDMFSV